MRSCHILLLVTLPRLAASLELLGENAGLRLHSPVASTWSGPASFDMNTTYLNASLVYGGELTCRASASLASLVNGRTVLVPFIGFSA